MARGARRRSQAVKEATPASPPDSPEASDDDSGAMSGNEGSGVSTPASTRVRRGRGRPPKLLQEAVGRSAAGSPDLDLGGDEDEFSEPGTPSAATPTQKKRGRGRPSLNPRNSKNKGGPSHVTTAPKDEEGNYLEVENDELALPIDPAGEKKVDKLGNLRGGRDYRCRTFTMKGRGDRLYMLSTEPARCMGFRDSYLLFQRHKKLYKIIVDDEEKYDMIHRKLIPHSYKGRAIGIVTARSIFREFGAKIIIGGKNITDDYYEEEARNAGLVEGTLADPTDRLPEPGHPYNKNQYVAWHGASSVYHTGAPTVPTAVVAPRRKKVTITSENWMYEHAAAARNYNNELLIRRKAANLGVYEPHTNLMHYPAISQPTMAKFTRLLDRPKPYLSHGIAAQVVETVFTTPNFVNAGLSNTDPEIIEALSKEFGEDAECVKAAREQIRREKEFESRFM